MTLNRGKDPAAETVVVRAGQWGDAQRGREGLGRSFGVVANQDVSGKPLDRRMPSGFDLR
jgi:hypothetical protein